MNMQPKTRKRISVVMALCLILSLAVGTFAVYTDRFQAQTSAIAGTLDITLTESWEKDNEAIAEVYKPGTALKLNYSLANKGNMPADVRETFVITTDKELSNGADREFDLYAAADIKVDAEGNVTEITGKPMEPVYGKYTAEGSEFYTLTYSPAQFTLKGTGEDAIAPDDANAVALDGYSCVYYLVFNVDVDNSYQNVGLAVDYMAQALQHNNTGDETWNEALVISEKVTFGGQKINVVPELK